MKDPIFYSCLLALVGSLPPQWPVIGVLTQPSFLPPYPMNTQIQSSYVKGLEMAGAQVVPIFYRATQAEIQQILGQVNGVLIPGASLWIQRGDPWTESINFIFNYAKKQNQNGNTYPIWGTCMGFKALILITSGETDRTKILTETKSRSGPYALSAINPNSLLFNQLNPSQRSEALTNNGIFCFSHSFSVGVKNAKNNENFSNFWNISAEAIAATNTDENFSIVAAVEAKNYPFFATMFHPEKSLFEWRIPANRSFNSVQASQKFMNFFINFCKLNKNRIDPEVLQKKLIKNYPNYLQPPSGHFVQKYYFKESIIKQT